MLRTVGVAAAKVSRAGSRAWPRGLAREAETDGGPVYEWRTYSLQPSAVGQFMALSTEKVRQGGARARQQ